MDSRILTLLALASTALSNPIASAIAVPTLLPAATEVLNANAVLGTAVGGAMSIQSTLKSVFFRSL